MAAGNASNFDLSVEADKYSPKFLQAAQDGVFPLQGVVMMKPTNFANTVAGNNNWTTFPTTPIVKLTGNPAALQTWVLTLQDVRNLQGRYQIIVKPAATTGAIAINLPAGCFWVANGVATGNRTVTMPAANLQTLHIVGHDNLDTPVTVSILSDVTGLTFA